MLRLSGSTICLMPITWRTCWRMTRRTARLKARSRIFPKLKENWDELIKTNPDVLREAIYTGRRLGWDAHVVADKLTGNIAKKIEPWDREGLEGFVAVAKRAEETLAAKRNPTSQDAEAAFKSAYVELGERNAAGKKRLEDDATAAYACSIK